MTAHGSDNMVFRFPESLSSEINEKAILINKKKGTKFGLGVFQGKVLFLNIIQLLNFTREAESRNVITKQLSTSEFVYKISNYGIKIQRL